MDNKKRVRRGDSFGRMGLDRSISNSLKSPNRQKQRCKGANTNKNAKADDGTASQNKNSVRFNPVTPLTYLCSHYDKGMTPEQQAERRTELWYSKCDFQGFLKDRVATIRLLKMVRGDANTLRDQCPDVCLRGLEPYQCTSLNQDLQSQRQWHQRVILAEQSLQRKQKREFPERIRRLAVERSEWAGTRARQLAALDEMEVQLADAEPQMRRRSLATAQIGMENLMLSRQHQHQHQRRRASTMAHNTSSSNVPTAAGRRVPVDMAILREWNAKFMADMRSKNGGAAPTTTATSSYPAASAAVGATDTRSLTNNMNAASLSSSLADKSAQSRMALRRQSDSLLSPGVAASMAASTLGYGEHLSSSKDHAAGPSFRFPLRTDSLVGLRRESLMASRAAALAGVAAATSSSASPSAATGGFRFPVRRDSLSNVHWS